MYDYDELWETVEIGLAEMERDEQRKRDEFSAKWGSRYRSMMNHPSMMGKANNN